MRVVGQVTGPAQAAIPGFSVDGLNPQTGEFNSPYSAGQSAPNAYSLDVLTATRALKEAEEWATINGSVSANANQYNGIIQVQGATNTVAKSGTGTDRTIALAEY